MAANPSEPPTPDDPRLEIPESLRTPVDRSALQSGPLKQAPKGVQTPMSGISLAYALAIEFVVYIGVCAGLGYLIDRFAAGGGVTWTVVGAVFGLVGAVIRLMRASAKLNR